MDTQEKLQNHKPGAGWVGKSGSVCSLRIGVKSVSVKVLPPSVDTATWQSAVRSPTSAFVLIGSPYFRQATATILGSTRLTATWGTPVANDAEVALMLTSEIFFSRPFPACALPLVVPSNTRP